MEKITLKLGEILQLETELNGLINQQTNEVVYKGFLKQNIRVILKYELKDLSDFLTKEKSKVEEIRDELIKKYGTEDKDGKISVEMFNETKNEVGVTISKKLNENYIKLNDEFNSLLNTEKEIEYPEITKDDLKSIGTTTDDYQVLFKLIKKDLN